MFLLSVRVVDVDADVGEAEPQALEGGQLGIVLARGPQIMKGYYKNKNATDKVIDRHGWYVVSEMLFMATGQISNFIFRHSLNLKRFNTEDLGYINPATGDLFINGRAKDTVRLLCAYSSFSTNECSDLYLLLYQIVLSNGENIEPSPIEDAMLSCKLIDQVVLAGQDEKRLSAIVVVNPQELADKGVIRQDEGEQLQELVNIINDPHCSMDDYIQASTKLNKFKPIMSNKKLSNLVNEDVKRLLRGFRIWEQVGTFMFTLEPFAMSNNLLTQSYKVKRSAVLEKYWAKVKTK